MDTPSKTIYFDRHIQLKYYAYYTIISLINTRGEIICLILWQCLLVDTLSKAIILSAVYFDQHI